MGRAFARYRKEGSLFLSALVRKAEMAHGSLVRRFLSRTAAISGMRTRKVSWPRTRATSYAQVSFVFSVCLLTSNDGIARWHPERPPWLG